MKRKLIPCLLALALAAALAPSVLAAEPPAVCYPTAVIVNTLENKQDMS